MTGRRAASLAAALCVALACATDQAIILEREDVQSLQVVQSPPAAAKRIWLRISGVVGHGELAYFRHRELPHGTDTLDVLIELRTASEDTSGSFSFVVFVPPEVSHVVFGDERVLIWRRP